MLIDGPKGYKAIRLAVKALKYKNVKKIFIFLATDQDKVVTEFQNEFKENLLLGGYLEIICNRLSKL